MSEIMSSDLEFALSSVEDLEDKLSTAKQSLIILNENIRRFVGRGPKDIRLEKYEDESKRNEHNDRAIPSRNEFSKQKQPRRSNESNSVFCRLSDVDRKDTTRASTPRINSRVIRELPSRKEVVEAQGTDSESRARNRRMFGSLLGTLQKFCQEESRLKTKEDKKAKIERKLEKQELQERALIRRERDSLFLDRKRKQIEIRQMETKMARLKDFKTWELSMVNQKHQIRTKAKPHLFFRPQTHNALTEKLLLKSKSDIDSLIQCRRIELQTEFRDLERTNYIDEENVVDESGADYEEFQIESSIIEKCDKNSKENKVKSSRDKGSAFQEA